MQQPGWECWEKNVAQFGCGGEGACWGGLGCCMPHWGVLSQALALVPVSAVVDTLASSCSPEKNAVWSQQLFLPGRQLPGGTSPLPTACFPSFPQEAAGPVSMCSPGHSESPQLWLLSAAPLFCCPSQHRRGQGSARWLSGCLGYTLLRSHAGHHQAGCLLASRRRSGFAALPDWGLWQAHGLLPPLGEETRFGPSSPTTMLGLPGWAAGGSPWACRTAKATS